MTPDQVIEAAKLLTERDNRVRQRADLATIVLPDAWGHIEGGRAKGAPIGRKFSLFFQTQDELDRLKVLWNMFLDERDARDETTLTNLGVTNLGAN